MGMDVISSMTSFSVLFGTMNGTIIVVVNVDEWFSTHAIDGGCAGHGW